MNTIKNYLLQPSTWLGFLKIASATGLVAGSLIDPISAVVMSAFGLVDVIRKEKV